NLAERVPQPHPGEIDPHHPDGGIRGEAEAHLVALLHLQPILTQTLDVEIEVAAGDAEDPPGRSPAAQREAERPLPVQAGLQLGVAVEAAAGGGGLLVD